MKLQSDKQVAEYQEALRSRNIIPRPVISKTENEKPEPPSSENSDKISPHHSTRVWTRSLQAIPIILAIAIYLFPPRLGLERFGNGIREARMGRMIIFSDPSPDIVKRKIGVLETSTDARFIYSSRIDYQMWWTEMALTTALAFLFIKRK